MDAARLKVGGFARTPDEYGMGKLVQTNGDHGRVLFRHSWVETEERWYPLHSLERGFLAPHVRAYWFDSRESVLRVGRVTDYLIDGEHITYTVRFPNGKDHDISERELEARSDRPNQDPTQVLAEGLTETQFFYDRRLAALQSLVNARGNNWGLTGLTSASVDLLPHQVEVIRRISTDPLQRYLLADEVGMGKTIEAGCIIRQCLLDNPKERVVVLAPVPLVRQWERELNEKFGIGDFPGRVSVRSFDALRELAPDQVDTLVIDEAHHLVGGGGGAQVAEPLKTYQRLVRLAHSCRRLFVLTATPVLGDEEAMLRLLHLLDPHIHRLKDSEAFRRKLANRQEYGRLLMRMNPGAPAFMLKRIGTQLLEVFPGDDVIAMLAPKLISPSTDPPDPGPEDIVRTLKRHITETYRLHQRLVRTRRTDLAGWELLPRQAQIRVVPDPSPSMVQLWDCLEDWRDRSLVAARSQSDSTAVAAQEAAFARRFLRLFEAIGQGTVELAAELDQQTKAMSTGREPTFEEERAIVQNLRRAIADENGTHTRVTLAARTIKEAMTGIKHPITGAPKVVAFASSGVFAGQLEEHLTKVLGRDAVGVVLAGSAASDVEEAVERAKRSSQPMALVCDRSGEEGLNLHFVDAVVHLDLPLAPGRLEQRIGRVDRYGRRQDFIRHYIILPSDGPGSPWLAWHELLQNGFQLYSNSISDVQFLLEEIQQHLALTLYRQGATGLTESMEWVKGQLETERTRLDEQYALDQLAIGEEESSRAFEVLEEADDADLYEDLNRWVVGTLQLKPRRHVQVQDAFLLQWTDHTLMPSNPWHDVFGPALKQPLTYDRTVAVLNPGVRLVRPGSMLVEAVRRHLSWDDRGIAFATWRVDPRWDSDTNGEWIGFRLTYVVEFDMHRAAQILSGRVDLSSLPAIRRRADALFSPWIETLTFDTFLSEVTDPQLVEILRKPYTPHKQGGFDFNLGSRREHLFSVVPADHFYDLCKRVRKKSEELVWASPRFKRAVERAAERTRTELMTRNQHLERRKTALIRLDGINDPTLDQEIAINRALSEVVTVPHVRLDAIGCFVVSNRPPGGSGS